MSQPVSRRQQAALDAQMPLTRFLRESAYASRMGDPDIYDFVFGNPHDMPLPGFVDTLRKWVTPHDKNWYAYTQSDKRACAAVARRLYERRGIRYAPDDIFMTGGAFSALAVVMATLVDPGDEIIFSLPPWFLYEGMVTHIGGVPVKVRVRPDDFDLDLDAIEAAITPRTRAVIVNTPNNPTGRIYAPATLTRLAAILERATAQHGRAVYLVSDEPYNRLVFDGRPFHTPATYYPRTFVTYSFGKVLLTPGARLGYLAMHPDMPDADLIRPVVESAQVAGGWLYPNALMQYAVDELEELTIDLQALQDKRDGMIEVLRRIGYQVHVPEGTFYLLPKSPIEDDLAFFDQLVEHNVYVLPGTVCDIPGYFRISLTANAQMIENSVDGFAAAFEQASSS